MNEITNDWDNDREKIEQLTFLLKEENRLILKIEELSINSDELDNFDSLNNLEVELNEVECEIENLEISFQKLKRNRKYNFKYQVEPDDIADVISKITGIPISKVVSNERKKLVNLELEISEKVIGCLLYTSPSPRDH